MSPASRPRTRVARRRPEPLADAPIRTKVEPRVVTLDELEPETRARAERLLELIPEESFGEQLGARLRETQACLVALATSRRAS